MPGDQNISFLDEFSASLRKLAELRETLEINQRYKTVEELEAALAENRHKIESFGSAAAASDGDESREELRKKGRILERALAQREKLSGNAKILGDRLDADEREESERPLRAAQAGKRVKPFR